MAKKTYIGVSGKADEVKKIYVGVSGKARKVTKVYVGVNGIAKQVYQADHSYRTVVTPATCTTQGYTTYTCTFCGYTYKGNYTPIKGHSMANTATAAVCQTCSVCGQQDKTHNMTNTASASVCRTCSVCKYQDSTHDFSNTATASVCRTCGTCNYQDTSHTMTNTKTSAVCQTCTTCGYQDTTHPYSNKVTTVATCASTGVRTYTCGTCNYSYTETIAKNASNHTNLVSHSAVAATCTTSGNYAYSYCSGCKKYYNSSGAETTWANLTIAAKGHTAGAAATCTTVQTCTVCGTQLAAKNPNNHTSITTLAAKAATCMATGLTEGKKCTACGKVTVAQQTVAKNASNHSGAGCTVVNAATASVCKKWSKCGASYDTSHNYTSSVYISPTCTVKGTTKYTCKDCGYYYTSQDIPALGHNSDNNLDCTTDSKCTRCGIVLEEAPGHDWSEHPCICATCGEVIHGADVYYEDVEPTCTESGQTGGYYCADCGEVWEEPTILPATGHGLMVSNGDYEAPTCTEAGQNATYSCSRGCGYTTGGGTIPALGHDPDCDADCTTDSVCTVCGEVLEEAWGHDWVSNDDYEEPTCEDDGHEESEYCGNCGETRGGDTIPATGHAWEEDEAEVSPTCSEGGQTAHYSCTNCGAEYGGEYIEPTGDHHFDNWCDCQCTECGEWFHSYVDCVCENCGDVSHNYVNCICTECGEEVHNFEYWDCTCEDCGYTNHTYVDGMCACGEYEPGYDPDACLMASTPILMADGTEKAISEVQAGDMIKSWDIENNEYIDVAVLGSYQTGVATKWSVYSFDNGKELTIYDQHNIYCKENNSIKKSTYWKPDQTALTLDGAETTYSDVTELVTENEVTRHTLLTENNLYFANGILCGHHPRAKYKFVTKGLLTAEPEQLNQYKATNDIYQAMNGTENEEYRKEAAELLETIRKAKSRVKGRNNKFAKAITKHKDQNKPDIMKLDEPMKLREKSEFVEEVDTLKQDIKTINKSIRKARKELNKIKEKYGVSTKTVYECWREAYNLDMEYLKNKNN